MLRSLHQLARLRFGFEAEECTVRSFRNKSERARPRSATPPLSSALNTACATQPPRVGGRRASLLRIGVLPFASLACLIVGHAIYRGCNSACRHSPGPDRHTIRWRRIHSPTHSHPALVAHARARPFWLARQRLRHTTESPVPRLRLPTKRVLAAHRALPGLSSQVSIASRAPHARGCPRLWKFTILTERVEG